jgi:hypothetical protein
MTETVELKIYTGVGAATESPAGDATNWNLMFTDAYDSTQNAYRSSANRVPVPSASNAFSYERWMRLKFTGAFTTVSNVKVYRYAGAGSTANGLSDSNLDLTAGTTAAAATPVNTVSAVATTILSGWDSSGEAIDITPVGNISPGGFTKYFVVQLKVPSTVTTPGDIGAQTIEFSYDVA